MKRPRSIVASVAALVVAGALTLGGIVVAPGSAGASGTATMGAGVAAHVAQAANPFARGPAPGPNTLNANGPFAVSSVDVSGAGQGFNNATVYYPNDTSQGTFAAIAVSPGFVTPKLLMLWAGPKIASHGFVVAVIETNTLFDIPGWRADQMQAVLRFLTSAGAPAAVRSRIDPTRLGAMGHSMGGGGALEVGDRNSNPRVKAVVGLEPWDIGSFSGMDVPSMIIGAQNDAIAPVASHAIPFYTQITQAEKQYVELAGADHLVGTSDQTIQSRSAIAWFKRYLDNDTRYNQFLCPPVSGPGVSTTRNTCPT
jgi:pimeloyl-ACP methyl ester carboxylesterase